MSDIEKKSRYWQLGRRNEQREDEFEKLRNEKPQIVSSYIHGEGEEFAEASKVLVGDPKTCISAPLLQELNDRRSFVKCKQSKT